MFLVLSTDLHKIFLGSTESIFLVVLYLFLVVFLVVVCLFLVELLPSISSL